MTDPDLRHTAFHRLSRGQATALVFGSGLVALCLFLSPFRTLFVINSVLIFFYLAFSIYKLGLVCYSVFKGRQERFTETELTQLDEASLPVYSILVPLYHEASSVGRLVRALEALDYPKAKLDIQLLLEEDDPATIDACRQQALGPHYRVIVVPPSLPRTKPKVCNIGLRDARGEWVVVYDAEDAPEPDQLKKSVLAFQRAGPRVACLQAKLNFYNMGQNTLTKWFTAEYSHWFDLYLPGLSVMDAPIPLGGTSNHFRTRVLRDIGGWDAYNVTEDCDLGMRLYRDGWRTLMFDSTTWEEATSRLGPWIRQRSRWIKGYAQTYLVHLRQHGKIFKTGGWLGVLHFHFLFGGTVFCLLITPVYWLLTLLWLIFRFSQASLFFPPVVLFPALFCLIVGNYVFVMLSALGCLARGCSALVPYALLAPAYWFLMCLGAWKGCLQLIVRPHYWEKTPHGFCNPTGGAS